MESKLHAKILYSELVYKSMVDIARPSPEQKVNMLTATDINTLEKKQNNTKYYLLKK